MQKKGWIKFLGTAGARFVMIRQLRASGGMWVSYGKTNILIDPGPGSLVRCRASRPKLDPSGLDAIILTHKHLDHSNDMNVMIEAMTGGGFTHRGIVCCPADALGTQGVIFEYLRRFPEQIVTITPGLQVTIKDITCTFPHKNIHSVETYGVKCTLGETTFSLIGDTRYFPQIPEVYRGDIVVYNTVFKEKKTEYDHLSLPETVSLIQEMTPPLAIISHFGMTMLKAKPHILSESLRKELPCDVRCAYDGMKIEVPL